MDATKHYEFTMFGAMDATKPYEFIGLGATKPARTCLQHERIGRISRLKLHNTPCFAASGYEWANEEDKGQ